MIDYDNKKYAIDLNAFIDFIKRSTNDDKFVSSTITETYSEGEGENDYDDLTLLSKEVIESTDNVNNNFIQIKFDLLKSILDTILYSTEEMSFSQRLAFNTFLECNIIKEVN